ncbi:NfeD family protein [Janthinobacterium aquaticum]|uniref:NfeD family protein n=1 Tax=Janthinobacterium sp. FT58W TaxID=2654254 RepID=UPI001264D1A5|nr:NfeD family protein [Janthinobacterium sp. FT58W]KAB8044550.1 NfeD family protein [Janthinobacterium sp. FT58W]
MAEWVGWFLAAGALLILELFTGTFYLLMIAIGISAGGLVALTGANGEWQALTAAIVGVAATLLLRRSRYGKAARRDAAQDPNINLDIGQSVAVAHWVDGVARVMYRGALWDVELGPGGDAQAGHYIIRAVRGSRLIVG